MLTRSSLLPTHPVIVKCRYFRSKSTVCTFLPPPEMLVLALTPFCGWSCSDYCLNVLFTCARGQSGSFNCISAVKHVYFYIVTLSHYSHTYLSWNVGLHFGVELHLKNVSLMICSKFDKVTAQRRLQFCRRLQSHVELHLNI